MSGVSERVGGLGGHEGLGDQGEELGRGSSLSKNPQHVYNNPKYFFLLHIRNTVVFLTNHKGAMNSLPLCSISQ